MTEAAKQATTKKSTSAVRRVKKEKDDTRAAVKPEKTVVENPVSRAVAVEDQLQQEREKLLHLRLDASKKKLKDTSQIRKARKMIARLLTQQHLKKILEKEVTSNNQKEKEL